MLTRKDALSSINGPGGRGRGRRARRGGPRYGVRRFVAFVAVLVVGVGLGLGAVALFGSLGSDPVELRVIGVDGPIPGATITGPAGASVRTVENGSAGLDFSAPAMLEVTAPGYEAAVFDVQAIPNPGPLFLQLNPVVLQGRVVDPAGQGIEGALVDLGDRDTVTDELGSFEIVAAVPGTVEASKPAWSPTEVAWSGEARRLEIEIEPVTVRGLYVTHQVAGDPAAFAELLDMAASSSVNSLVFDTKLESGEVLYDTSVEEAELVGAARATYDPREAIAAAREHGLYTITRIVTFQDPFRSEVRTEHAIQNEETGDIWRNTKGLGWMDPTDRGAWTYPIALAKEACEIGFDEVQFDYVRFPTDGDVSITEYDASPIDSTVRIDTITEFLSTARSELNAMGCAVSADIFGIVMSVSDDQGLGQLPESLSYAVDAVSPMIYPSHYGPGWLGFDNPNDFPAEVVGQAIEAGMPKLEGGAVLRPWLQAFSWSDEEILESIGAAEENGLGWMLWHSRSEFSQGALPDDS
ncbi:MAG: putative glycoside hydrolase [Acidimicrobiia bacterium]|nr:putative glycoside hydrolase [Acidimicrobiia bacterium]